MVLLLISYVEHNATPTRVQYIVGMNFLEYMSYLATNPNLSAILKIMTMYSTHEWVLLLTNQYMSRMQLIHDRFVFQKLVDLFQLVFQGNLHSNTGEYKNILMEMGYE